MSRTAWIILCDLYNYVQMPNYFFNMETNTGSEIGGWGNWGQWTPCSAVCGTGRRARLRFCDRPPPSNGEECPGLNVDVESCDGHFCGQPSGRKLVSKNPMLL